MFAYPKYGGRNSKFPGVIARSDDMVGLVDGANFFGHHYSKGNQANKQAIDRAAGSGVFQRDPDSILTMTPHENDGCFTIELILRNHPPRDPFVLEWRYPLFHCQETLDPTALKQSKAQKNYDVSLLPKWLGGKLLSTANLKKRVMEETGMSSATFYRLRDEAEKAKLIVYDGTTDTWERVT